jgi:hypothetical protein
MALDLAPKATPVSLAGEENVNEKNESPGNRDCLWRKSGDFGSGVDTGSAAKQQWLRGLLQQEELLSAGRDELLQEKDAARPERALVLQKRKRRRMLLQCRFVHDAEQAGQH